MDPPREASETVSGARADATPPGEALGTSEAAATGRRTEGAEARGLIAAPGGGSGRRQGAWLERLPDPIPGGDACLALLDGLGVGFEPLDTTRGVDTPVRLTGPIGRLRFYAWGDPPLVCDCRLGVALVALARELEALGVTAVRFSGAYVWRTQRSGRPSLHARGLAIDLHELEVGALRYRVDRDYRRAEDDGTPPLLQRLERRLRDDGRYREILTPASDADHRDHFHLGLAPLPDSPGSLMASPAAARPSPPTPAARRGSTAKRAAPPPPAAAPTPAIDDTATVAAAPSAAPPTTPEPETSDPPPLPAESAEAPEPSPPPSSDDPPPPLPAEPAEAPEPSPPPSGDAPVDAKAKLEELDLEGVVAPGGDEGRPDEPAS